MPCPLYARIYGHRFVFDVTTVIEALGSLCMPPDQVNECGLLLHHFGTIVYDKAKFSKVDRSICWKY